MADLHRVLIVGVGSIGERHLRCFHATGRCAVSFVEVNDALRRTVAERYGVRCHATLDAALAAGLDAAVIATPAPLHVPLATRLAEADAHLLIEKPLSTNLEGVEHLSQVVAERRLVAAVAYVYRVQPALAAIRQTLVEGRFGTPVQLVAVGGQHFPTYRPAYRNIYYTDRAQGGGAIQDALTHLLNAGEWLLGPIDRLVADAAHQVLPGVEVEDTVHVLTRQGSVLGCYGLNQHQAPNELVITVICEHGTVRCDFHEQRWRWMTEPGAAWHDEAAGPLERDTQFLAQANGFLDAIEEKAPPHCTLAEGIQSLRVNLAALASVQQGSWQSIPVVSSSKFKVQS
jgi:predicted dehydrogenase